MKYRTTRPFIAFGKTAEPGDVVELTEEQAAALNESDCIAEYEVKVMPPPDNKKKPVKSSASSRVAPVPRKKTRKKSKASVTK